MAATSVIRSYAWLISPLLGNNCRFYPSCSSYALKALAEYGLMRGCYLSLRRIFKCHPWHPGGLDPVPEHTDCTNHLPIAPPLYKCPSDQESL